MSDPLHDKPDFDLEMLPATVANLLTELNAAPRLVAHLRLVHDVAIHLCNDVSATWPSLQFNRDAVLFGASTHDIGKAIHTAELYEPGDAHERDGRRLLLDHGISDDFARFADTHAAWKRQAGCTLDDLLVALADTCWKGKRSEKLEDMVCEAILSQINAERWEVFASLDAIVDKVAVQSVARLAWQEQY